MEEEEEFKNEELLLAVLVVLLPNGDLTVNLDISSEERPDVFKLLSEPSLQGAICSIRVDAKVEECRTSRNDALILLLESRFRGARRLVLITFLVVARSISSSEFFVARSDGIRSTIPKLNR
jgi:hypothetical protein